MMDFVADRFEDGRRFRALTVLDMYTRESLIIVSDVSLTGERVVGSLENLRKMRGAPKSIQVDSGSEFYSKAMDRWAYRHGVELEFIGPGRPMDKGHIESFNGKLRDECLNVNLFYTLDETPRILDDWRAYYNEIRPHRSLGACPPVNMPGWWPKPKELLPRFPLVRSGTVSGKRSVPGMRSLRLGHKWGAVHASCRIFCRIR